MMIVYDNAESGQYRTETHASHLASTNDILSRSTTPCFASSSSSSSSPAITPNQQQTLNQDLGDLSRESRVEVADEAASFLHSENLSPALKRRRKAPGPSSRRAGFRHVYEDVISLGAGDCKDIRDYYIKYDASRAKELIDALFLTRGEICPKCAKHEDSPVYSDRFVYERRPLLAKEVPLTSANGMSIESSKKPAAELVDFMPIYKLAKPIGAEILHNGGLPLDAVDLKASLEPSIVLLGASRPSYRAHQNEPPVQRWFLDRGYARISEKAVAEPVPSPVNVEASKGDFQVSIDQGLGFAQRGEIDEPEQNRSSLLMLEPLLLLSSDTARKKEKYRKSRLARSEDLKLVRIVIAYTLSFFLLVTITFYVVYFT